MNCSDPTKHPKMWLHIKISIKAIITLRPTFIRSQAFMEGLRMKTSSFIPLRYINAEKVWNAPIDFVIPWTDGDGYWMIWWWKLNEIKSIAHIFVSFCVVWLPEECCEDNELNPRREVFSRRQWLETFHRMWHLLLWHQVLPLISMTPPASPKPAIFPSPLTQLSQLISSFSSSLTLSRTLYIHI